jgi:hypothetical protein
VTDPRLLSCSLATKLYLAPFGSNLGLTVKRDPTTFDTEKRKDNAFQQYFFTKNNKDNAPMALQYHP